MKTTEQKLTGARKKIHALVKENQQLMRDKVAADYISGVYKKKAAADNARLASAQMFIAYLLTQLGKENDEIIIPIDNLYSCAKNEVLFEPIPETNSFRVRIK